MLKLAFLMCLAALVAFAIPVESEADAGLMPLHRHGPATHRHDTAEDQIKAVLVAEFGVDPRLAHDDPNRPDESHDYDVQPKDGTTVIRYDDGSSEVMQVMGDTAAYDGRFLVWDPHGGGMWKDPEDPYFTLIMWPPYPPEFPVARAIELDMSAGPGNYIQRRGNW